MTLLKVCLKIVHSPLFVIIEQALISDGSDPLILFIYGHNVLTYHRVVGDLRLHIAIVLHRRKAGIGAHVIRAVIDYFAFSHWCLSTVTKMLLTLHSVALLIAL